MSIFRRKSKAKLLDSTPGSPRSPQQITPPLPPKDARFSPQIVPPTSPEQQQRYAVDDFGRPVDRPAFAKDSENGGVPFGAGYGVGDDKEAGELQLLFGYAPLETQVELDISTVGEIVERTAKELRARGLDTPLILSSLSLDISLEGSCSLIRSYLADKQLWANDLGLAEPLAIGSFMKWGLARLINDRGGRGFVGWELYTDFKASERISSYPPRHVSTHLIGRLASPSARLLTHLLSLFSSIAAHSKANGMPPRKLASLFSPYLFGLSDDETFDATYQEWQRATDATEHLLLAFIRDQQAEGSIPTFLEKYITGYPAVLNVNYSGSPRPPTGARLEEVTRVKRLTRFHSRNLIASAGTWDVPRSHDWALFFPLQHSNATADPTAPPATIYTPHYRHLLNIRSNSFIDDGDDDGDMQRYKSVTQKSWSRFGELGFKDVEASKLDFDLTESERNAPKLKRGTVDWGTFADSGFSGDTFTSADLIFHQSVVTKVQTWPASQQVINAKLREAERALPAFPYDTTPHEEGRVMIDALFFECWADTLVSGGWAKDELKESSFALVQWKSRPKLGEVSKGRTAGSDDRTEDRWVLIEEFVPGAYRSELLEGKNKKNNKRQSFLRVVRRRSSTSKTTPPMPSRGFSISHPHHQGNGATVVPSVQYSSTTSRNPPLKAIDESVFTDDATPTKLVSLSQLNLAPAPSHYAGSISTTGAGHGHEPEDASLRALTPEPPYSGVGGTFSSQPSRPLAQQNGAGLGNVPAPPKLQSRGASFLARISSRRQKYNKQPQPQLRSVSDPLRAQAEAAEVSSPEPSPRTPAFQQAFTQGGAPTLGAVVQSPSSAHPSQLAPPAAIHSDYNTPDTGSTAEPSPRDSEFSRDDPYGGIEGDEVEEVDSTLVFRGDAVSPRRESLPPPVGAAESGVLDHESQQPRDDRYLSGVSSDFSTRVSKIVGHFEGRETNQPNGCERVQ